MGEIFERPLPAVGLAFTGERLTSEFGGQTEIEHLHRYMLARHLCRGKRVLDVASGEGYGAAMLAQVASSVVGVEIAAEVVAHAAANYQRENLSFLTGDALSIPLDDSTIDVVISFETIEHLNDHDRFLSEVRRVLCPGGILIISTPDRDNYSPADHPPNPYHVLELTCSEYVSLIGRHFRHLALWWQRPLIGSVMLAAPGTSAASGALCFERRGNRHFELSGGYARPQYLIGVCTDGPMPELTPSVYIDTSVLHTRELLMRSMLDDAQEKVRAADLAAQEARQEVSMLETRLASSESSQRIEVERLQAALQSAQAAASCERAEIASLLDRLQNGLMSEADRQAEEARLLRELSEVRAAEVLSHAEIRRLNIELGHSKVSEAHERTAAELLRDELKGAHASEARWSAENDRLRSDLDHARGAAASAASSLNRELIEAETLRGVVSDLQRNLLALRNSTAWRMTALPRGLVDLFRKRARF